MMSPWTYIIIGGVFGAISTICLTLGLNELKRRDEIYSLSTPPSIEVTLKTNDNANDEISFYNNGPHSIVEIEVYPIGYTLEGRPMKIAQRMQPAGDMKIADSLKPNEKINLPVKRFTLMYEGTEPIFQNMNFLALVIVFRREIDNKRYVSIEPFYLSSLNNRRVLGTLYGNTLTSQTGSPTVSLEVLKEIMETEKILFRAN